jgi:hypothetical protein
LPIAVLPTVSKVNAHSQWLAQIEKWKLRTAFSLPENLQMLMKNLGRF